MTAFTESTVEEAALAWLESLGRAAAHGPDLAADPPGNPPTCTASRPWRCPEGLVRRADSTSLSVLSKITQCYE